MFVHEGSGVGFPASPALWIRVLRYFSSSLHLAIFFSDVKLFFGEAFNDGLILHPRAAFVKRADWTKSAPGSRIFLSALHATQPRGKGAQLRVDPVGLLHGAGVVRRLHEAEFGRQNSRFVEAHRT